MLNDDTARAVRRFHRRKVEHICDAVYQEFYKQLQIYGTISADEILIVGLDMLERCTITPMLRLQTLQQGETADQEALRQSIIYQIAAMLGVDPNSDGN